MVKVHPTPLSFRRIRLLTTFYLKIFITPHFNLIQKKKFKKGEITSGSKKQSQKKKKIQLLKRLKKDKKKNLG